MVSVPTFDVFFEREYERLVKAVYVMTSSITEAEDVAQEAFVRCLERWERVRQMDSPIGYVFRTAMNLNRKRIRSILRRRDPEPQGGAFVDGMHAVDERIDIVRLVRDLPFAQREALVLTFVLGMTTDEVAAILGIAPGSVRGRIHRARQTLQGREA